MYNQPSEPYGQYNPQSGQQSYEQIGAEPYSQQPYTQQPPYGQPIPGQVPYGQQPYMQQVPLYAQPQPVPIVGIMVPQKDWLTTLLLCIFLGCFGVHSFYTGRVAIGVVQLLTLGGCGIWALVDFIMILTNSYTDNYGRPLLHS